MSPVGRDIREVEYKDIYRRGFILRQSVPVLITYIDRIRLRSQKTQRKYTKRNNCFSYIREGLSLFNKLFV
jgi:hypothetical protein